MKKIGAIFGLAAAGIVATGILVSHAQSKPSDHQQIIDLEHGVATAKNVDEALSYYDHSPDLVLFDVIPPLEYSGYAAVRKDFENFFATYPTSHFEITDLRVANDGRIGFANYIEHFTGVAKDGKKAENTWRVTDCLEKKDGKWKIVNEHISVPVDVASGRADLNAKR
ncbi:MAG TPA: nuclear transport factor 2 family protein [Candidatus Binataceae bacterium]|nr:nuclear transport factor 2 family protein [Candidatus Binataceae bacterium]